MKEYSSGNPRGKFSLRGMGAGGGENQLRLLHFSKVLMTKACNEGHSEEKLEEITQLDRLYSQNSLYVEIN